MALATIAAHLLLFSPASAYMQSKLGSCMTTLGEDLSAANVAMEIKVDFSNIDDDIATSMFNICEDIRKNLRNKVRCFRISRDL